MSLGNPPLFLRVSSIFTRSDMSEGSSRKGKGAFLFLFRLTSSAKEEAVGLGKEALEREEDVGGSRPWRGS